MSMHADNNNCTLIPITHTRRTASNVDVPAELPLALEEERRSTCRPRRAIWYSSEPILSSLVASSLYTRANR